MAMPRYRYAIGQAPVRFPSLNSDKDSSKQVKSMSSELEGAQVKKQKSSNELRKDHKRNVQDADKLQSSRLKAKSMYEGNIDNCKTLKVEVTPKVPQNTPRTSMAGHGASRSRELCPTAPSLQSAIDERTPLISSYGAMTQKSTRPASTSISHSSRPSSLFWTQEEAETQNEQVPATTNSKSTNSSTYGSLYDAKTREDDPYGYRAMAGPSLLPSFHEQQIKQQRESANKNRSCGFTLANLHSKRWLLFTISASLITIFGLYHFLS